jgi:hypothetical protein
MSQTITITLESRHIWRLEEALLNTAAEWHTIAHKALMGERPNASPEGAQLLAQDTLECLEIIKSQLTEA